MIKNCFITENYCDSGDVENLRGSCSSYNCDAFKTIYSLRAIFLNSASVGTSDVI